MLTVLTDIKQLTMNIEDFKVSKGDKTINIDIVPLMKAPIGSEEAYLRVNEIAEITGARLDNFLNSKRAKEFILLYAGIDYDKVDLKRVDINYLRKLTIKDTNIPIIIRKGGRYGSGTELHQMVALEFLDYSSTKIGFALKIILKQIFKQADIVKIERQGTIREFHPLSGAIAEYLAPNIENPLGSAMIKSTVMDFVNLQVIGMTARRFRALKAKEGIIVHKDHTRQYFDDNTLNKIIAMEKKIYMYITEMGFRNFHQIKGYYLDRCSLVKALTLSIKELKKMNKDYDNTLKRKPSDKKDAKLQELYDKYH